MENLLRQREELQSEIHEFDNEKEIYLTSENSPALKSAMEKISTMLLERNRELYRRLANQC